jgi:glycosyltransferase involved in cell wall biosynthesis
VPKKILRKKKSPATIIWVHSHFLYWMGGTKYIFEVLKVLKQKKHRVVAVVEQASPFVTELFKQAKIRLVNLNVTTSTSAWYWLGLPFFLSRRCGQLQTLIQQFSQGKSSPLVVTSMFPMQVVMAQLGQPFVQLCYEPFAFFHDQEFIQNFPFFKRVATQFLALLYAKLDVWGTQHAQKIVTLNTVTQSLIQDIYHAASTPIYAGVNTQLFKPFVGAELKKKYRDHQLIIHSTDYSPVKGTDRVIKAFAGVAQKFPAARLLITSTIKNEAAQQKLQALATELGVGDKVEFLGFVPIELLPQYYSLAKVMVQGSSSLRSGTTSMALPVKEAMACGTPAIRPDAGGEDVIDGKSGFLVDPQDTPNLTRAVNRILGNPRLGQKMGKAARQSITRKYSWPRTAARFLKAIN